MYVVGVAVFAYDQGGASAVGIVALIRVLSGAITAPFAAVLTDRFRRERVDAVLPTSAARSCSRARCSSSPSTGRRRSSMRLAALVNVLSTTFRPAQAALLPSISRTPEELTAANVTMSTIAAAGLFLGPALGGVLLGVTNVETLFAITAGTFLLSAFQVARIRAEPPPAREREAAAEQQGRARRRSSASRRSPGAAVAPDHGVCTALRRWSRARWASWSSSPRSSCSTSGAPGSGT